MSTNPSAACPGMISKTSGRTCSTVSIPGVFFGSAISPYVLVLVDCARGIRCSKRIFVFLPDNRLSPPCAKTQEGEGRSRPAVLFQLSHSTPGRPFEPGYSMMPSARAGPVFPGPLLVGTAREREAERPAGQGPGGGGPLAGGPGLT